MATAPAAVSANKAWQHFWFRLQFIRGLLVCGEQAHCRALAESLEHELRQHEELWLLPQVLELLGRLDMESAPARGERRFAEVRDIAQKQVISEPARTVLEDFVRDRRDSIDETSEPSKIRAG